MDFTALCSMLLLSHFGTKMIKPDQGILLILRRQLGILIIQNYLLKK